MPGLKATGTCQRPVIDWVADRRRHHAFADTDGDPHSLWLVGTTLVGVAKGFWHAHLGWLFVDNRTNPARFAPDLLADPDIRRINDTFLWWAVASLAVPALLGGLISWPWWGAIHSLGGEFQGEDPEICQIPDRSSFASLSITHRPTSNARRPRESLIGQSLS